MTERSGRVVIATLQNRVASAQHALAAAYQKRQPHVEVVWDTKD